MLELLPLMLAVVVMLALIGAPLGLRFMARMVAFGLGVLAVQLLLIQAAPAVGAWITAVAR